MKHEGKRKRDLLLNTLLGRSLLLCNLFFSSGCFFRCCGLLLWWFSFFSFIRAVYLFAFIFGFLGTLVSALLGAELERRECLPWSEASTGLLSWAFLFLHRHPLHHLLHPTSVDGESINVLKGKARSIMTYFLGCAGLLGLRYTTFIIFLW